MTLGELIAVLERERPEKRIAYGFKNPHSWRGIYAELAFEPAEDVTVAEMLRAAKSALGETYTGWKGGEYKMDEWTDVHIATYGESGSDTLGPMLLGFMLHGKPIIKEAQP